MSAQDRVVRWCAEECQRQETDAIAVADLYDAWASLMSWKTISLPTILRLGAIVEPKKNANGLRRVHLMEKPEWFTGTDFGAKPENIERLLLQLLENKALISADEFYQEFEDIHPFLDGNGRVGALIYNFLKGTLRDPLPPPRYRNRHYPPTPYDKWTPPFMVRT